MLHIRPSIFRSFQACLVVNVSRSFSVGFSRTIRGMVIEKSDQKKLMG